MCHMKFCLAFSCSVLGLIGIGLRLDSEVGVESDITESDCKAWFEALALPFSMADVSDDRTAVRYLRWFKFFDDQNGDKKLDETDMQKVFSSWDEMLGMPGLSTSSYNSNSINEGEFAVWCAAHGDAFRATSGKMETIVQNLIQLRTEVIDVVEQAVSESILSGNGSYSHILFEVNRIIENQKTVDMGVYVAMQDTWACLRERNAVPANDIITDQTVAKRMFMVFDYFTVKSTSKERTDWREGCDEVYADPNQAEVRGDGISFPAVAENFFSKQGDKKEKKREEREPPPPLDIGSDKRISEHPFMVKDGTAQTERTVPSTPQEHERAPRVPISQKISESPFYQRSAAQTERTVPSTPREHERAPRVPISQTISESPFYQRDTPKTERTVPSTPREHERASRVPISKTISESPFYQRDTPKTEKTETVPSTPKEQIRGSFGSISDNPFMQRSSGQTDVAFKQHA